MPKQRSPDRDKVFEIYKQHDGKILLIDIANKLNLPEGTIRGWKAKDKWSDKLNGTFQNNIERSNNVIEHLETNEKSWIINLTKKQELFVQGLLFIGL